MFAFQVKYRKKYHEFVTAITIRLFNHFRRFYALINIPEIALASAFVTSLRLQQLQIFPDGLLVLS